MQFLVISLQAQSLDELIEIAIKNNPGIKAQQTEIEAIRLKMDQVTAMPDPQINGSVFMNPMMLPMGNQLGSISAMQMFPWFGSLDAKAREVESLMAVNDRKIDITRNDLVFRISSTWFSLLEIEEKLKIKRKNLQILQSDQELATAKFQYAKGPMVDIVRADIMIEEIQTEINLLDQKKTPLMIVLNRLLNRDAGETIVISDELKEPGFSPVGDTRTVESNPALAVLDKKIDLADAQATSADFMRKPMIGAGLQYMLQIRRKNGDLNIPPNTGRDMVMPMFSLTLPIWRKKYDAAVQENQVMKRVYSSEKEEMLNDLASMYAMTVYELEEAQQQFELLNKQIIKTNQAIELLQASYQTDGTDFEEMLRLQQKLFSYELEKVMIKKNYQVANSRLEYLTGYEVSGI